MLSFTFSCQNNKREDCYILSLRKISDENLYELVVFIDEGRYFIGNAKIVSDTLFQVNPKDLSESQVATSLYMREGDWFLLIDNIKSAIYTFDNNRLVDMGYYSHMDREYDIDCYNFSKPDTIFVHIRYR